MGETQSPFEFAAGAMARKSVASDRLNAELAEVAAHRDRLKVALYADSAIAIAHRATIEGIRHGGLKILARLLNEPAGLRRMMEMGETELVVLAEVLMDYENEIDAAGVLNSWMGK